MFLKFNKKVEFMFSILAITNKMVLGSTKNIHNQDEELINIV